MDLLMQLTQFMADAFQTDNRTILMLLGIALVITIGIQIVKKIIKLLVQLLIVSQIVLTCFVVTRNFSEAYDIKFDTAQSSVTMDITQVGNDYTKYITYSKENNTIQVYTSESDKSTINCEDIQQIQLTQASEVQTVTILYGSDSNSIDLTTEQKKAKVLYSLLKTLDFQKDIKTEVQTALA